MGDVKAIACGLACLSGAVVRLLRGCKYADLAGGNPKLKAAQQDFGDCSPAKALGSTQPGGGYLFCQFVQQVSLEPVKEI